MNTMFDVQDELAKIKATHKNVMDKFQASNRLFFIGKLGRQLDKFKLEVGTRVLENVPGMKDLYPRIDMLEKLQVAIMLRGYKNTKSECAKLLEEIEFLESYWASKLDLIRVGIADDAVPLHGQVSTAEPGLPLVPTNDSKVPELYGDNPYPGEEPPTPLTPELPATPPLTKEEKLLKATTSVNKFLGRL